MAELKAQGKKMDEAKKFHGVAFWAWNIDVDNCAICRKYIMDHLCIECQEQKDSIKDYIMDLCIECQEQKDSIKDCICASGQCSHSFYFHSMQRWLKTRNVCPMCNQECDYENFGNGSKCI